MNGRSRRDPTTAVIAALVALVAITAAVMVGLEWTDSPNTEELVMILVGLGGTTVATQIVSLARTERGNQRLDQIAGTLNSELDQRIAAIVRREVPAVVGPIIEAAIAGALACKEADGADAG